MPNDDLKEVVSKVVGDGQIKERKQEELIQLVVFELDDEEYAVQITDLREIIRIPEITPIPNTPEFIRGILNLRGKIVVAVDLEKRFHLVRENKKAPRHIIIAEVNENVFGVIVDEVAEILRVPVASVQRTPALVLSKIHADYLKGVVILDIEDGTEALTEEKCKEILEKHAIAGSQDGAAAEKKSRLLILLDLPKMLQEKELLEIGAEVGKATGNE